MGVHLTWQNNSLGDSINVYRSTSSMDVGSLPEPLATIDAGSTEFDDLTAVDGETYYYRVALLRGTSSAVSTETSFTVAPPLDRSTWNPSDRGSSVVLSNGNKTAQAFQINCVRGQLPHNQGVRQFEVLIGANTLRAAMLGVATSSAALTNYPGSGAGGWAYYSYDGHLYAEGVDTAYGAAFVTGDVVGVVVDFDLGALRFYLNGANQGQRSILAGLTLFPFFGTGSTSSSTPSEGTLNTGDQPFAYPVAGATAWG